MTPNAASVVLRAWIPRLLVITAAALFGLALSSSSAHAESLLDPVGHTSHQASHVVSKAARPATQRVASRPAVQRATPTAANSVRRSVGPIHRVKPAPTVTRTSHVVKRNLSATQGITARATRSLKGATAHLSDVKGVLPVVLGTVGSLPLTVGGVELPPLGAQPILLVPPLSDLSPAMTRLPAIAGTQTSSATTADLPATPTALDRRAARAAFAPVDSLVDQLNATGSTGPLAISLVMLALGAAAAASGSLTPAASGGSGFALVPAPVRPDTGSIVRRYGIPSRQSAFRTPARPGFFPA